MRYRRTQKSRDLATVRGDYGNVKPGSQTAETTEPVSPPGELWSLGHGSQREGLFTGNTETNGVLQRVSLTHRGRKPGPARLFNGLLSMKADRGGFGEGNERGDSGTKAQQGTETNGNQTGHPMTRARLSAMNTDGCTGITRGKGSDYIRPEVRRSPAGRAAEGWQGKGSPGVWSWSCWVLLLLSSGGHMLNAQGKHILPLRNLLNIVHYFWSD